MTGDELLAIPLNRPERVFTDASQIDAEFKKLAKRFHPDLSSAARASDVMAHLQLLHREARKRVADGSFGYGRVLTIQTKEGREHHPYLFATPFDLGELYVGERSIIYATERSYDDLAKRALDVRKNLKFDSDARKTEFARFLPPITRVVANADRTYTIIQRSHDQLRLADVLRTQGPIAPEHVAWITSSLYNMCNYLSYAQVRHLDISVDTYWVEPKDHVGALLGGWYYTGHGRHEPLAAPNRTLRLLQSGKPIDPKKGSYGATHLRQVRELGRVMLGKPQRAKLLGDKSIPEAMRRWFTSPAGESPVEEYRAWDKCLEASFGRRRFVKWALTSAQVYPEEK